MRVAAARSMTLADEWYEAATWNEQIKDAGLVPADIHRLALEVLRLPPSPVVGSAPQGAASLAATVKVDVVGQLERSIHAIPSVAFFLTYIVWME